MISTPTQLGQTWRIFLVCSRIPSNICVCLFGSSVLWTPGRSRDAALFGKQSWLWQGSWLENSFCLGSSIHGDFGRWPCKMWTSAHARLVRRPCWQVTLVAWTTVSPSGWRIYTLASPNSSAQMFANFWLLCLRELLWHLHLLSAVLPSTPTGATSSPSCPPWLPST